MLCTDILQPYSTQRPDLATMPSLSYTFDIVCVCFSLVHRKPFILVTSPPSHIPQYTKHNIDIYCINKHINMLQQYDTSSLIIPHNSENYVHFFNNSFQFPCYPPSLQPIHGASSTRHAWVTREFSNKSCFVSRGTWNFVRLNNTLTNPQVHRRTEMEQRSTPQKEHKD